jgi:hypothetical protein
MLRLKLDNPENVTFNDVGKLLAQKQHRIESRGGSRARRTDRLIDLSKKMFSMLKMNPRAEQGDKSACLLFVSKVYNIKFAYILTFLSSTGK